MNKPYRVILILIFIAGNLQGQIPEVSYGTIQQLEHFPSQYVDARNIDVWLPPNYSTDKQYAVLYMHDGMSLFDAAITWNKQEWGVDETLASLFEEGEFKECIVVGIYNNGPNRQNEYFPQRAFEYLSPEHQELYYNAELYDSGQKLLGGKINSDDYLRFIVHELKPFIDTAYSVYSDRENTFVAGSSYGGLISMYSICEYPEVFSKAVCMSTHWPGLTEKNTFIPDVLYTYMETHLPDPDTHYLYFDHGSLGIDSLYKPCQIHVDEIMRDNGFNASSWRTLEFEGTGHTETFWSKRLHIPMTFILKD